MLFQAFQVPGFWCHPVHDRLGVEDDSDDEAAHPPADAAPEPPDKADAEAEPKPRRRERKLETLLRRQGFHFERRKKRIIFRHRGPK